MNARHLLPRLLLLAGLAAAITWAAVNRDRLDLAALDAWLSELGLLAVLAYLGLYAAGTVAFLPGALFALAMSRLKRLRANTPTCSMFINFWSLFRMISPNGNRSF